MGRSNKALAYLLVLPCTLITIGIYGYTLIYTFYLSFTKFDLFHIKPEWVGFLQYKRVLLSSEFWDSIKITVIYVVGIMFFVFIIGLSLAMLLDKFRTTAKPFRVILFLPWIVPNFVAATTFLWMLDPLYGVINYFGLELGIISKTIGWLGHPRFALQTIMAGVTWKAYPFLMIMNIAALQSVPKELYDAALVDGANAWQRFRYVTLPHIRGVLITSTLMMFLMVANSIEMLYICTEGGPAGATTTLPVLIYNTAFKDMFFGKAATISVYQMLIMLVVIILTIKYFMKKEG